MFKPVFKKLRYTILFAALAAAMTPTASPQQTESAAPPQITIVGPIRPFDFAPADPATAYVLSAGMNALVERAMSPDASVATKAIDKLRAAGQEGVDAMRAWRIRRAPAGADDERLRTALDAVCKQRDCAWSGLYWYTDLDEAKRAAKQSGKLILSLRLLGYLDDDLSCANSRFFRTILYPDRAISQLLRDRFVLHWQSVRPVPKVTIDFGDGRTMKRTLTGNSIHYVLDADGNVIDGIPGLYAPAAFYDVLNRISLSMALKPRPTAGQIAAAHLSAAKSEEAKYDADRKNGLAPARRADLATDAYADAMSAGLRVMSKMAVERPMLTKVSFQAGEGWSKSKFAEEPAPRADAQIARLDERTLDLIRFKEAGAPGGAAHVAALIGALQKALVLDTLRNEYEFHPRIHRWLAAEPGISLDELNRRVYAQIFLTPDSDPWLGLLPPDAYTGIQEEGISVSSR